MVETIQWQQRRLPKVGTMICNFLGQYGKVITTDKKQKMVTIERVMSTIGL